jgi:hypothetical protein
MPRTAKVSMRDEFLELRYALPVDTKPESRSSSARQDKLKQSEMSYTSAPTGVSAPRPEQSLSKKPKASRGRSPRVKPDPPWVS